MPFVPAEFEKHPIVTTMRDEPILRYHGSVLPRVQMPVALLMAYAVVFTTLSQAGLAFSLHTALIPIMTVMIGLLVGLRTNTSYDRWWEGRKLWSTMAGTIRSFFRAIWFGVSRGDAGSGSTEDVQTCMRLLVAYGVAVKRHLREEHGIEYVDLIDYLPPKYIKHERLQHAGSDDAGSDNVPLEILDMLYNYVNMFRMQGRLDAGVVTHLNTQLHGLTDHLSSLERILTTPIPMAFLIHLRQVVTLYCLLLPPQLYEHIGWLTVPVTGIAAFVFFGVDAIGREIENPFGYDPNDLDLDAYCNDLKRDLANTMKERPLDPRQWHAKHQ